MICDICGNVLAVSSSIIWRFTGSATVSNCGHLLVPMGESGTVVRSTVLPPGLTLVVTRSVSSDFAGGGGGCCATKVPGWRANDRLRGVQMCCSSSMSVSDLPISS